MADLVTLDDVGPLNTNRAADNGESYRDEATDLERAKQQIELDEARGLVEYRKKYSRGIFVFVAAWLVLVFGIILADGWNLCGLEISDPVLVTLAGGTTVSVLGLFAIVANYFFPKP